MPKRELSELKEDIAFIAELKKLILDEVKALYGPRFPATWTFDVITTRESDDVTHSAYAIVYHGTKPYPEWTMLLEGESRPSTAQAMEALYEELQKDLDKVTSEMGEDWTYDGADMYEPEAGGRRHM